MNKILNIARPIFFITIFFLYAGCEEDIDPFNYNKEETVIYGLLNIKDSVQLVKVFKCYSTKEESNTSETYDLIKHYDTSDIDVFIEQWKDNEKIDSIPLHAISISDWQQGHDYDDSQVYITKQDLDLTCIYKVVVFVKEKDKRVWAEVKPFGKRNFHYQYYDEKRIYGIYEYQNSNRIEDNTDIITRDVNFYHETVYRFLYVDIVDGDTIRKYVEWQKEIPKKYWPPSNEVHKKGQLYARVYNYIGAKIPKKHNVKRIAVGLDRIILYYNHEIKDFNRNLLIPRSDFERINYVDNVNNGSGLVGLQYYYTYFAQRFTRKTIDSLCTTKSTRDLNFIKYYLPFYLD